MKIGDLIRVTVAVIGASLMVWGVFEPMLGIRLLRDESLMQLRPAGAVVIIALAVITVVLAIRKRYSWLYATGLVSAGLLIYAVFVLQAQKASAHQDLEHIADSPLRNFGSGLVDSAILRYGWVLVMLGALLILSVPLVGSRLGPPSKKSGDEAADNSNQAGG
jgi:hypothetical protein